MTFTKPYLIRLAHCDATGIVFLPNYFYVFNALVEDWFCAARRTARGRINAFMLG